MSFPILELALVNQIKELVELPSSFEIYTTANDNILEEGVVITEEMVWVTFKGIDFINSKTTPPTSEATIDYSVYIAVQDLGCCNSHHAAMQYLSVLLRGLYNSAPTCLDDLFALTGTGWLINSIEFVRKWDSNHYVYKLSIKLPVMINIVTCTTYTGVTSNENCGEDNPFDPDCYVDYDRQVLICPDGEKPFKINIALWRNKVGNLGSNIVQDFPNN